MRERQGCVKDEGKEAKGPEKKGERGMEGGTEKIRKRGNAISHYTPGQKRKG